MQCRPTTHDLRARKGEARRHRLHVRGTARAKSAAEAGVRVLSCERDRAHEPIRAAAAQGAVLAGAQAVRGDA